MLIITSTINAIINTTPRPTGPTGLGIAAIIIGIIILIIILLGLAYFMYRRIKNQRQNHGEYRPQFEENLHAKNLPYISPPNIEGLI